MNLHFFCLLPRRHLNCSKMRGNKCCLYQRPIQNDIFCWFVVTTRKNKRARRIKRASNGVSSFSLHPEPPHNLAINLYFAIRRSFNLIVQNHDNILVVFHQNQRSRPPFGPFFSDLSFQHTNTIHIF